MPKYTKEELNERIIGLEGINDDIKVSLMEDISDSFTDEARVHELEEEIVNKDKEYNDLMTKYKERFLVNDNKKEEKKDFNTYDNEEVIDIRSLF